MSIVQAINISHLGIPTDLVESDEQLFWEFIQESDRKAVENHVSSFYQNNEPHRPLCREFTFNICLLYTSDAADE